VTTLLTRRLGNYLRYVCAGLMLMALIGPVLANDLVVGKMAPPITLNALDGSQVNLRDLRGKVVIVTFWATWCDPCREELPLLSQYARAHADQGLVVLGFSLDTADQLEQVKAVAKTLSFPVGLLGDPHVPGYGRIWHLPVSFTIDREGRLVDNGWHDKQPAWTSSSLEKIVTPLLTPAWVDHP
jgi:cytochrome c biogenesis protein CcmG, thiol:disulfide interchange protein DsbE